MSAQTIETLISQTTIDLTVATVVPQTGIAGWEGTKVIPTRYVVEEGQLIDPALYGLAHTDQGVLLEIIGQLRKQAAGLDNGRRRFVNCVADNLNDAIVAIRNSTEL